MSQPKPLFRELFVTIQSKVNPRHLLLQSGFIVTLALPTMCICPFP